MKIAKISLAAIVALGAFSSLNATPLEEAIKNVDFSGFARYRYTNDKTTDLAKDLRKSGADHRFRFEGSFKAALDDNFFGVLSVRYDTRDGSGNNTDNTNTDTSFGVKEFYLGYKVNNTTITAGKQLTGTYFDSDLAGTGIRIVNKDIQGLTLAAVAFDALELEVGDAGANRNNDDFDGKLNAMMRAANIDTPNLYGVAAMGSYDPLNFKLWFAHLTDVANLIAVDAALKFDLDAVKLGLQGQYVHNDSDHELIGDADFYAVKGDVTAFGVNFNAGYIGYEADDNKLSFVSIEDNGKLINPSKVLNVVMNGSYQYYNTIQKDNEYWFVGLGYTYDKFKVEANYIDGEGYSYAYGQEVDRKEWNVGANYKYSKKLNFSGFYASAKEDAPKGQSVDNKHDRLRFEAKYSF